MRSANDSALCRASLAGFSLVATLRPRLPPIKNSYVAIFQWVASDFNRATVY